MSELAGAMIAADQSGVHRLLDADVRVIIDGGDRATSGTHRGRADAAAALASMMTSTRSDGAVIASVNGVPGLALTIDGVAVAVLTAQVRRGSLADTWVVTNPDKLRRWNAR